MSKRHPVVAVTGSSGAGTSTVKRAFEHIFAREGITPAVVEGTATTATADADETGHGRCPGQR